jgi:putative transposase
MRSITAAHLLPVAPITRPTCSGFRNSSTAIKPATSAGPVSTDAGTSTTGNMEAGDEADSDVLDYIEMFYNPKRRHGHANDVSPVEFKNQYFNRLQSV